ncbi:YbhB YbcL family protein [Desulfovibrio sp. X2]|uniref:YbhB/YbcL family Raf kinase inhibitor-like protein n=1 Tax=Desulfovibrio sp. X2 TaxID=941449 RepID=UPI000358E934|nr:YbhB/YbcL family Raf kinase inhibitor-like protein [Desulfovibrio sp. X2]EPR43960.1 YbhB YbcL family protein [Desulfovibrio sp. X2]
MSLTITSPAFASGSPIPARFSCDGEDVSPALAWKGAPTGTVSLALLVDDPDAPVGDWVHWIVFNLPADSTGLPENAGPAGEPGRDGKNSWGRQGWGGPCPPGGRHRYFFKLFALDAVLDLPQGATKKQLLSAMQGHILARAELMGTYAR